MTDKEISGVETAGLGYDGQKCRAGKCWTVKLTDKSATGKNVKHVVLTYIHT